MNRATEETELDTKLDRQAQVKEGDRLEGHRKTTHVVRATVGE